MRNPLSSKVTMIKPSGIRKFFDIVNDMEGAISLGVGEGHLQTALQREPWEIVQKIVKKM